MLRMLHAIVAPFVAILAHRAGPQHLPASGLFLALVLALHSAVYVLAMTLSGESAQRAVTVPLLDMLTQSGLFALTLFVRGFGSRLMQTLAAVFGTEVLLNILALPLLLATAAGGEGSAAVLPALAFFGIVCWSVAVKGHILRHAIEVPYSLGTMLAVVFLVIFLLVDDWFAQGPV